MWSMPIWVGKLDVHYGEDLGFAFRIHIFTDAITLTWNLMIMIVWSVTHHWQNEYCEAKVMEGRELYEVSEKLLRDMKICQEWLSVDFFKGIQVDAVDTQLFRI